MAVNQVAESKYIAHGDISDMPSTQTFFLLQCVLIDLFSTSDDITRKWRGEAKLLRDKKLSAVLVGLGRAVGT